MNTPYQTPESHPLQSANSSAKKRLKSIDPLRAGVVLGVAYAVVVLAVVILLVPLGLTGIIASGEKVGGVELLGFGVAALVLGPIVYAVIGFISGLIFAWIYNFIAKLSGGIEFTLEDV